MSRNRVPAVNASLLHELRMFIQQFVGGRQENYYSMKIAQAQAVATQRPPVCTHAVLKCCFCVDTPTDATVVINGYSSCSRHEVTARSKQPIGSN
jgi:hypothetical protein